MLGEQMAQSLPPLVKIYYSNPEFGRQAGRTEHGLFYPGSGVVRVAAISAAQRERSCVYHQQFAPKSKINLLIARLRLPASGSFDDFATVTCWQIHSIRGPMASALRKKGHAVVSNKIDGVRRRGRAPLASV